MRALIIEDEIRLARNIAKILLTSQLSQLGNEIGFFGGDTAVSFHHKPYHSTGGYTLWAAAGPANPS